MEYDDSVINTDNQQMAVKLEIKEEPVREFGTLTQVKSESEGDVDFHSETVFATSHVIEESTDTVKTECDELYSEIEIKQEHCSTKSIPTEVKYEAELPSADTHYQNVIEEIASQTDEEDAEGASGLHSESLCRNSKTPFYKHSRINNWENSDSDITKANNLLNFSQLKMPEEPEKNCTLDSDVKVCRMISNCKTSYRSEMFGNSFQKAKKQLNSEIHALSCTEVSSINEHKLINEYKRQHRYEICSTNFTRASNLKEHKLIHEGKRPHICEICKKSFTHASTIKKHKLTHEGKRPHICEICNKSFIQASTLKQHKLIHKGIRAYTCDICNQSFSLASNMKKHKLIHEGIKSHTCEVCNKSFTQKSSLNEHKLIHEGKKPHTCEVCNKSFSLATNMKKHKLIHEGIRPHTCVVCNKNFTLAKTLMYHVLIHEGKRPHTCEICKKAFTQRSTLKHHKLSHVNKTTYT